MVLPVTSAFRGIFLIVPQEHWHFTTCRLFVPIPTILKTVKRPNTFPVMSPKLRKQPHDITLPVFKSEPDITLLLPHVQSQFQKAPTLLSGVSAREITVIFPKVLPKTSIIIGMMYSK
jgi:hypothetical protein